MTLNSNKQKIKLNKSTQSNQILAKDLLILKAEFAIYQQKILHLLPLLQNKCTLYLRKYKKLIKIVQRSLTDS